MHHLLFFDGNCPLCSHAVRWIMQADTRRLFGFAPLEGETAQHELFPSPPSGTLVLLEDYGTQKEKQWTEGRGILRILWLLGGKYAWVGWLSSIPFPLFNPLYRWVARHRYQLFKGKKASLPVEDSTRFLP